MRTFLSWLAAFAVGFVVLVGLIALINSRDKSNVDQRAAAPGKVYGGKPALPPALKRAVARGNVVVLYRDAKPPAGTKALVPPGGKVLVTAGQAVLLDHEPTLTTALAAVSARRIQTADVPEQLQPFVDYWLGR